MLNFPDSPAHGQTFPPYIWDGAKWVLLGAQGSASMPAMNAGTGAPGVSSEYTRGDHQHPSDTTRAPVVSPIFTGTVTTDYLTVTGQSTDQSTLTVNGIATLGHDPGAPMDTATKQYVDARASSITAYVPLSGATMTGRLYPADSIGGIGYGGQCNTLEIQSGGGHDACMTFHRPGAAICNFGLATDHNFYFGGGSYGVNNRLWTTRDFGNVRLNNCRLAYAGDYLHGVYSAMAEPFGGAVQTGGAGPTYGPNHVKRYRYLQWHHTSWWTVGYA